MAFVALSVGVLIAKETGGEDTEASEQEPSSPKVASTSTRAPDAEQPRAASADESKLVVSYLHGSARCGPCRTLQAYATEAVETHFAKELADGSMEFRIVNVATPENRHLQQHYEIYTQSVIVSEMQDGEEIRWRNLDRVWDLLRDRNAYFDYIRREIEDFGSEP